MGWGCGTMVERTQILPLCMGGSHHHALSKLKMAAEDPAIRSVFQGSRQKDA